MFINHQQQNSDPAYLGLHNSRAFLEKYQILHLTQVLISRNENKLDLTEILLIIIIQEWRW